MTEQIQSQLISRRTAFLFLAGLGIAAPVAILTAADAEAQTPGMERREERREGRQERREERRQGRQERREDRRDARTGAGGQPTTTGSSTTAPPK